MLHNKYEKASSQKINMDKTSMVFSKNVKPKVQVDILQMWMVRSVQHYEKYLGLPLVVDQKYRPFQTLNIRFGINFKTRRNNCFLKVESKC